MMENIVIRLLAYYSVVIWKFINDLFKEIAVPFKHLNKLKIGSDVKTLNSSEGLKQEFVLK